MNKIEHHEFRKNVSKNKKMLKDLASLLSNEIQKRFSIESAYPDFRFLLPLAQWVAEQGGYTITPEGNNPGNIMEFGKGAKFHRANNKEKDASGKSHTVPANFKYYPSMEAGTEGTFNQLQRKWLAAYLQILNGGSVESYVNGLYPGDHSNYATEPKHSYLRGMKVRLREIIKDYLLVFEDDLKEIPNELMNTQKSLTIGSGIPNFTLNSYPTYSSGHSLSLSPSIARSLLESQIKELQEVQTRTNENGQICLLNNR